MKNYTCLAEGYVFPTDIKETGINANEMIVGPTRCGKTASVVEPKLIHTHNGSLIVSLTKRALVDTYAPVFRERGYEVWDLNLAEPKQGNVVYDPMDFVENESDILQLARTIVEGERDSGNTDRDPYWIESGTSGLAAILNLAYLRKKSEGEKAGFKDFYHLYEELELKSERGGDRCATSLDDYFDQIDRQFPGNQAGRMWKTIRGNAFRTANCIYSIMNNGVDKLMNKELVEAMDSDKKRVSFEEIGSKKVVLFVTTSPVNKSQQKLATMFFADAFRVLFEYAEKCPKRELPVPVHLVCDDFACGSIIPDFDEYISVFCAKGISTTLLLQSESQLEQMYGKHAATTIINNCDTYLYMGGMDDVTCNNISRRRNVPVEDVYSMPLEQVVLFRRGSRPVVSRRYQTYEDPEYKKLEMAAAKRAKRKAEKAGVEEVKEVKEVRVVENTKQNLNVIKEYLSQKEWKFLCDDKHGFITVGFNDAGIVFWVSDELVDVQTWLFKEVPEEAYHEVSEYLNKVNPILKEGYFKVDPRKGIRYRIVSCVKKGTTVQASRVEEMLDMGSKLGGQFGKVIDKIIDEGISAEEAFNETILEILASMEEAA